MKRALIAMHIAVLLWGFTGVLGRAISLDFPILVWWRMLLTALFIALIITGRKGWVPIARKDMGRLVLVGMLMGVHWVAFYGAIKFSNASVALICLSTSPIFTSLLDPLVNKSRWNPVEILFGLIGLAGVAVIALFDAGHARAEGLRGIGIAMGVVAAILSAVFTVINKSVAAKYPARTMVFWEMTSGWVFISICIIAAIASGTQQLLLNPGSAALEWWPRQDTIQDFFNHGWHGLHADWLWLVLLALCCTVWAQSLALTALKQLSTFTVTLSVNLEPVYGVLLAFIFYEENKELGAGFYAGVLLIILSVALQMGRMLRQRHSAKEIIEERGGID